MSAEAAEPLRGFRMHRCRLRRARRWVRTSGGIAISMGLAAAVVVLFAFAFGPRTGAYRSLTVLSGSMNPAIPVGSVVVVVPVRPDAIRVGDIVTYNAPLDDHRVVTHRVVGIEQPGPHPVLVTKGDANAVPDPWRAQVAGDTAWKVRMVVPGAGKAIAFLRSRPAHVATVFVLPGLVAIIWLSEIWRRPPTVPASSHG